MNTTILTVVLSGFIAGVNAPAWNESYAQAQRQGAQLQRPLAVVFGTGTNGWSALVRDSKAMSQLADKYVCVYVDTATQNGRHLAQSFSITSDVGIVISDRTGSSQAFWHQGELSSQALTSALQRYADPDHVVRSTETGTLSQTSYYQPLPSPSFGVRMAAPAANC